MHIWRRRGGGKRRAGSAPPALCSAASGSRGAVPLPDVVQLSPAFPLPPPPPRAPHPPGSSPLRFLGGESRGETPPSGPPLLWPRLPEPQSLSTPDFGSFATGSFPPSPLPPLPSLSLPFFSPASCLPQLPALGVLSPLLPPDPGPHPALQPSALAAELAPVPGAERRAGRRKHRASFIDFLPSRLQVFCIFPQRRGWAGRILSST